VTHADRLDRVERTIAIARRCMRLADIEPGIKPSPELSRALSELRLELAGEPRLAELASALVTPPSLSACRGTLSAICTRLLEDQRGLLSARRRPTAA
jgi:hypothetical protein